MNIGKLNKKQIFILFLSASLFFNIISAAILILRIASTEKSDDIYNNIYNGNSSPKYIFLFIGDGLGYSQMALASQYKTTVEGKPRESGDNLAMLDFDITGMAFTDNASTIIGESAASASAMASGIKTYGTYLNYDTDGNKAETITEKLKKQLNYRIGIISSVAINHATPAAFYAYQDSRYDNNGAIFLDLLNSNFDFFGGGIIFGIGEAEAISGKNFWELLNENKYLFVRSREDILSLENNGDKIIAVAPKLDIYGTLPYMIDNASKDSDALSLAKLTKKCIELLYNDNGFYIMVEGGKIDWCGHANDSATLIHEVFAFDEAISEAIDFYKKNPADTLIIVIGDHETGGLSLGYSETYTHTYLQYLQKQKISYSEFSRIISQHRQHQTPFDEILSDIEYYFGIPRGYDGSSNFYFNEEEIQRLKAAYEQSMIEPSMRYFTMSDYASYGMYDPLTTVITNITNKKSGIAWGTFSHTFSPVPVFAMGSGADLFSGSYHLSDIFHKLKNLLDLK